MKNSRKRERLLNLASSLNATAGFIRDKRASTRGASSAPVSSSAALLSRVNTANLSSKAASSWLENISGVAPFRDLYRKLNRKSSLHVRKTIKIAIKFGKLTIKMYWWINSFRKNANMGREGNIIVSLQYANILWSLFRMIMILWMCTNSAGFGQKKLPCTFNGLQSCLRFVVSLAYLKKRKVVNTRVVKNYSANRL